MTCELAWKPPSKPFEPRAAKDALREPANALEIVGMKASITLFVELVMLPLARAAEDLKGVPRVLDGDTLELAGVHVRLEAIDGPERDQVCLTGEGECSRCGEEARDRLAEKIGSQRIGCRPAGKDRYGRTLADCRAGETDLNAWLVHESWALSFVRYGDPYRGEEDEAREHERGLWAGAFIAPWDWRHRS